jgi:hypothetical protein
MEVPAVAAVDRDGLAPAHTVAVVETEMTVQGIGTGTTARAAPVAVPELEILFLAVVAAAAEEPRTKLTLMAAGTAAALPVPRIESQEVIRLDQAVVAAV